MICTSPLLLSGFFSGRVAPDIRLHKQTHTHTHTHTHLKINDPVLYLFCFNMCDVWWSIK